MNKGRLSVIAAFVVVLGAFAGRKYLAAQKEIPDRKVTPRVMGVVPDTVVLGPISISIPVTGKLRARNRIDLFAEVSGRLLPASDRFREGNAFSPGAILISIDDSEAKANLVAQKSGFLNTLSSVMSDIRLDYPKEFKKWEHYLAEFSVEKSIGLLPEVKSEKEKLFITARGVYTGYYNIKSAEARLDKYTLHAPFRGVVTEANIEPGTLVRQGQKLGEFISDDRYELEVSIKAGDLSFIQIKDEVNLYSSDVPGAWKGVVTRINNRIDPQTQSINLFIETKGEGLREGMFLNADIKVEEIQDAFTINRKLLNDRNEVFTVRDSVLAISKVEVVRFTDQTAVIRGLKNGVLIPADPVPNAYPGMAVQIIQP